MSNRKREYFNDLNFRGDSKDEKKILGRDECGVRQGKQIGDITKKGVLKTVK